MTRATPVLFQHVKRGTQYAVIAAADLQCSAGPAVEGTVLAIYVGTDDGKVWARPMGEFLQAERFTPVDDSAVAFIRAQAEQLVRFAARAGVVLSIEQRPMEPLAMGNYATVVSVREARS